MRISEYVACLEKLKKESGDLEVVRDDFRTVMHGAVMTASEPMVVEIAVKWPRELHRKKVYSSTQQGTGEMVVHL